KSARPHSRPDAGWSTLRHPAPVRVSSAARRRAMHLITRRAFHVVVGLFLLFALAVQSAVAQSGIEPVAFTRETLPNGLRVLYVPVKDTPVVHVRVLYHVGSRDERPDRQGFAHMFEHMMFRGSAHVQPEEHMKLIGIVGGYSNAF